MKIHNCLKLIIVTVILFGTAPCNISAQDTIAVKPVLSIRYFLPVNNVPYLEIYIKKKAARKFEPVKDIPVNVYFNEAASQNLLGKITTDVIGKGRVGLPLSFKSLWDSGNEFKFLAQSDSAAGQEALSAGITIKKAILSIDTTSADGARTVTAQLKEKSGNNWVPVKAIDMKLSIKRMLGNLSVGTEDVYTSDSTGVASAEYKHDSLPGDDRGNIILIASVEDNDVYGNLATEKNAGWGKAIHPPANFFAQRTLWSTAHETPVWLLFTVCSIVTGIWGTIIYLVFQIFKIRKMGMI